MSADCRVPELQTEPWSGLRFSFTAFWKNSDLASCWGTCALDCSPSDLRLVLQSKRHKLNPYWYVSIYVYMSCIIIRIFFYLFCCRCKPPAADYWCLLSSSDVMWPPAAMLKRMIHAQWLSVTFDPDQLRICLGIALVSLMQENDGILLAQETFNMAGTGTFGGRSIQHGPYFYLL